jgi:hypothetical protein
VYKIALANEQLEATRKELRDEYDQLEASYVSLLADKEVFLSEFFFFFFFFFFKN